MSEVEVTKITSAPIDPGGTSQTPPSGSSSLSRLTPGQTYSGAVKAAGVASGGIPNMRTFSQILEDEKRNRNILEIHIKKQVNIENNDQSKPRNFTFDELSIFIFDILHIKPEDIVAIDYTTGRYDHREIQLKPGVEATPFLGTKDYMKHDIKVTKQSQSITKVMFRNVPLNVPDEEIMNLALCYGRVETLQRQGQGQGGIQ